MKKRYLFLTLIVLLIIGAIAIQFRPRAVVSRSLQNISNLKTAHVVINIGIANSAATQQLLGEEGAVNLIIDGQYDKQTSGSDNMAANINLSISTESVSVTINGDVRLIDDKIYLLVKKAPAALPILEQFKGRWISFDRTVQNIKQPNPTPFTDLFTTVDQQGIAKINKQTTIHYSLQATNQAVIQFMNSIANILGSSLSHDQLQALQSDIATNTSLPVDIYVGLWRNNIRQITSQLQVSGGNDIKLTMLIDEPNQPVEMVAPQAITIEDLVNQSAVGAK